jgi:hypothetical protein
MIDPDKSQEPAGSAAHADRQAILSQKTRPTAPEDISTERIDLQKTLEQMEEVIENEGGVLIP